MKKTFFICLSFVLFLGTTNLMAQSEESRFSAAVMGGKTEYVGDRGFAPFDFNQPFFWNVGVKLTRYINPFLNVSVSATFGDLGYGSGRLPIFWSDLWHVYATADYKFANGLILPEDFIINPYIYVGLGLVVSSEYRTPGVETAMSIPVGVGAEVRIIDNLHAFWQTGFNFTTSDNLDLAKESGNIKTLDQFWTHQIGVKYSFDLGF